VKDLRSRPRSQPKAHLSPAFPSEPFAQSRDPEKHSVEASDILEKMSPRITIEPGKRSGQPCIRGLRITVWDVLNWLAARMTEQQILDDYPELKSDDFRAVYDFAAKAGQARSSVKLLFDENLSRRLRVLVLDRD
jgi:uncharacterized protein (DUF433 family)